MRAVELNGKASLKQFGSRKVLRKATLTKADPKTRETVPKPVTLKYVVWTRQRTYGLKLPRARSSLVVTVNGRRLPPVAIFPVHLIVSFCTEAWQVHDGRSSAPPLMATPAEAAALLLPAPPGPDRAKFRR